MSNAEAILTEAKKLFMAGMHANCIEYFTRAEALGADPIVSRLSRGAAYVSINEYDKAIQDFNRVLELSPDMERAHYFRGVAYMNKGFFNEATKDLSRAIELNCERGDTFFARGLALAEQGKKEESVRDLKTAIAFTSFEVERFARTFRNNPDLHGKSLAMLEGKKDSRAMVMNADDMAKLRKLVH